MQVSDAPPQWEAAWHEPAHAEYFSAFPRRYSRRALIQQCLQFNEGQLLRTLAREASCRTISDVGCGTGLFYGLLNTLWPSAAYTGFDIASAAVAQAKHFHPDGRFIVLDRPFAQTPDVAADLIFSRDVFHHQADPRQFLKELYETAQRFLVLKIRTRERGATVYDPAESCQYTYGHWVPFIVVNTTELIDLLRTYRPVPKRIVVRRHPIVLGGQNGRLLPKALYEPESGSAETAVLIEKPQPQERVEAPLVDIATVPEVHEQPLLYRWGRRLGQALSRV